MAASNLTILGATDYRNSRRTFGISQADRLLHIHLIGRTGVGKTTVLKNIIVQDLEAGRGLAVIDAHGDLIRELLQFVPARRTDDVVLFSPLDSHPVGMNILEHVEPARRHRVASEVVSVFKDVWGGNAIMARSEDILRNAVTALLDVPDATLLWLPRFLTDDEFRSSLSRHMIDPVTRTFWTREFAVYPARAKLEYTAPILNKIRAYITAPPLRSIFGQAHGKLDVRAVMDRSRILLIDLAKGTLGEDKSRILGKLFMMKLCLAGFSRIDQLEEARIPFHIVADECQNVASPIMASSLSELRKFHISLVLCHQYLQQLPREVQEALRGNVGTTIGFRMGADDAEDLRAEFMPEFTPSDLVNLGPHQIAIRLAANGLTTRPFSALTFPPPIPRRDAQRPEVIQQASRERWGRPWEVIERWVTRWFAGENGNKPRKNVRK